MALRVGDACEVAGAAAEGFPHCWFRGTVEAVVPGTVDGPPMLQVSFPDFDEGETEAHPSRSMRVRPAQPAPGPPPSLYEYQLGEAVDVSESEVWWHAVITDRDPAKGLRVFYTGSAEQAWVSSPAALRPGRVWAGGAWHTRPLPATLPKFVLAAKAKAAAPAVAQAQVQVVKQQPLHPQWPQPLSQQQQQQQQQAAAAVRQEGVEAEPADSNDENDDGATMLVRRSCRERESRTTLVDGHTVLKANMYDLEGGERSVFEQELARPKARPSSAGGPAVDWVAVPRAAKRPRGPDPTAPPHGDDSDGEEGGGAVLLSPGKATGAGLVRQHNRQVKADAAAMAGPRAAWLDQHLDVMRSFITPDVAAAIRTRAADARARGLPPLPPPVETQPDCLTAQMREYQLEGLRWLVQMWDHGVNGILADEMGLGKTLQTISLLSYLKFERGVQGPHLVVVPLSVLPSWLAEFAKFSPQMRVVRLHTSDPAERQRLKQEVLQRPDSFDVAVTTYDTVKAKDWAPLLARTLRWRYLVLDEGHRIKNEHTGLAHACRLVQRQQTLLLTGTPLQNNLHELYALLSYLHPDVFTTTAPFDDAFHLGSKEHRVDAAQLEAAHHMLRPLCLRRLKAEVELGMPPLVETRILCPLSEMQHFWYRRLLLKDSAAVLQLEREVAGKIKVAADNSWKRILALFMQLRKCCNHPYLFPGSEPDFDGHTTDESIVEASGKMQVLDRLLAKLKARGHRVVLFSQFNRQLDLLEDYMNLRGHTYFRLDGSTNRVQRAIDIRMFNRPGSDTFCYLLNTRAGGLGVNLQTADTCILYDSDWNPQCDLQAMARVHRIGQTKPVHVYRLCTAATVEERVQQRAEKKLYLDQMVNRPGAAVAELGEGLGKVELLGMLRFGADRIFQGGAGRPPTDAELEAILDRSGARAAAAGGESGGEGGEGEGEGLPLVEAKASAATFDAQQAPLSSYMFQGTDYKAVKEESIKDIGRAFWEAQQRGRGQRERAERLVSVDGFAVLKSNFYDMGQGEPSVFEREAAGQRAAAAVPKQKREPHGHQDFCQVCWDGGDLVLCDNCPGAYHLDCLGLGEAEVAGPRWSCPQHSCAACARRADAVGGMLFRCEGCAHAYCEDHLPGGEELDIVRLCQRFAALGYRQPAAACYVRCTPQCGQLVEGLSAKAGRGQGGGGRR